jgi:hypothetical protein
LLRPPLDEDDASSSIPGAGSVAVEDSVHLLHLVV